MNPYCTSCGHANPAGVFACQRCGQALQPPSSGAPGSFGAPSWGSGYSPGSTNPNQGAWQNPAYAVAGMAPMVSPEQKSAKQIAVTGMICSIAALIIGWCCQIGFILGPVGVVLGFIGRSKLNRIGSRDGMGMAYAAIGLGLFATLLPILFLVFILIVGALNPQ